MPTVAYSIDLHFFINIFPPYSFAVCFTFNNHRQTAICCQVVADYGALRHIQNGNIVLLVLSSVYYRPSLIKPKPAGVKVMILLLKVSLHRILKLFLTLIMNTLLFYLI